VLEELISAVDEGFAAIIFLGWLDDLHHVDMQSPDDKLEGASERSSFR
jgi:hypothetical protein